MKKILLGLSVLLSFNANAAVTNLLSNGSFESYTQVIANNGGSSSVDWTHLTQTQYNASAIDTSWAASAGAPEEFLEIRYNYAPPAGNGDRYAELSPASASSIEQTINVATDTFVDVSWWYAFRTLSEVSSTLPENENANDYAVFLNGVEIYKLENTGTPMGDFNWFEQSDSSLNGLLLSAGDNTLTFTSSSNTHFGINLDNVIVTSAAAVAAVPEPETYAMFLAGLGLLGFATRKRNV